MQPNPRNDSEEQRPELYRNGTKIFDEEVSVIAQENA